MCSPDPCPPSRVCVDKGNTYSCECLAGLTEDDCGPHTKVWPHFIIIFEGTKNWENKQLCFLILKNRVVYKLLSQPHKNLRHGKLKKTQLREATNGWLHPWTHPYFYIGNASQHDRKTYKGISQVRVVCPMVVFPSQDTLCLKLIYERKLIR